MSAVQGLRGRVGFGQRMFRVVGSALDGLRLGGAGTMRPSASHSTPTSSRTRALLARHVVAHGRVSSVLEISSAQSRREWFDDSVRLENLSLSACADLLGELRSIPSGSYDIVFSVDALDLVKEPWLVAAEIQRILRPGGLSFHATVFTTQYQPQPEDFFRFTPDGLRSLFGGLDCVTAEFDATECRRVRSRGACGDIFGTSREGWRVHYCGRKPLVR